MILDKDGNPTLNKCAGWRCDKGTPPPRFFCVECAADVPWHLLEAIKKEGEALGKGAARGQPVAPDYMFLQLVSIAATRALQAKCARDPAVLEEVAKEQEARLAEIKAKAAGLVVPRPAEVKP